LPNQIAQNAAARNEATFFTLKWQIVKITEAATARKIEQRHRREPGEATISSNSIRHRGSASFVLEGGEQQTMGTQATNHQQVQAKINAKSKRKN